MIQSTEVRIGNIVYFRSALNGGRKRMCEMGAGDVSRCNHLHEEYFGVPVTPKRLAKFGFLQVRPNSFRNDKGFIVLIWPNGEAGITVYLKGIEIDTPHNKYIHQLQNLYHSLTGEELTYKP